MSGITTPCKLKHALLGNCTLVRIEGVVWVVAFGKMEIRVPPAKRCDYTILENSDRNGQDEPKSTRTLQEFTKSHQPVNSIPIDSGPSRSSRSSSPPRVKDTGETAELERRFLRRAIQSIATGLSPQNAKLTRSLAVGLEKCFAQIDCFLEATRQSGAALIVRGAYGCGKTLTLHSTRSLAVENNFVFAETEIDASEVRLDQAPTVYATIMRELRFPDGGEGLEHLLNLFGEWLIRNRAPTEPHQLFHWLQAKLQCGPLAWMLADRNLGNKPTLINALRGIPIGLSSLRDKHPLPNSQPRWQYFKYGTQGDVGSYLISGMARLIRLIGFDGFIIALDEMEKWQDLDWKNQERAGNLLGGLIWGATAPIGSRECVYSNFDWTCDHSEDMNHSAFNGGCRFTTSLPCNLGILIAMTPRGEHAPEETWQEYGRLTIVDLPQYTLASFREHFEKVASLYEKAYSCNVPVSCRESAEMSWRRSNDQSARSGAIAITVAIDAWRKQ